MGAKGFKILGFVGLFMGLIFLASCAKTPKVHLGFHCLDGCNNGREVIEIGVYELADAEKINKVTYDDFVNYQEDPAEYLGDDLLNILNTFPLNETETKDFEFKDLDQRAQYIAIVGFFYQADLTDWKIVIDRSKFEKNPVKIEISENKLILK